MQGGSRARRLQALSVCLVSAGNTFGAFAVAEAFVLWDAIEREELNRSEAFVSQSSRTVG